MGHSCTPGGSPRNVYTFSVTNAPSANTFAGTNVICGNGDKPGLVDVYVLTDPSLPLPVRKPITLDDLRQTPA